MGFMYGKRIRQVIKYGWKDAGEISKYPEVRKSRISIFLDIWHCFRKYYVFSNQYKSNKVWTILTKDRESLILIGNRNRTKDQWVDKYYDNWRFLNRFTSYKWQTSPKMIEKRNAAYTKHFGLGENLSVQYGVTLICEHFSIGKITCGKNVLLARDCDIDYTGDIEIGDNVGISEGVKILTHNHSMDMQKTDLGHGCILTPLVIRDRVWIGARSIIMPGVKEIGRGAIISSNSNVKAKIPPYAVVMGNPAKIIGFRLSPSEIFEYEKEHYPESERISMEELERNYNKYFKNRIKEIRDFLKQ